MKESYLNLLKIVLTNLNHTDKPEYKTLVAKRLTTWKLKLLNILDIILRPWKIRICHEYKIDREKRYEGLDCPSIGETMVGVRRLENVEKCIESIVADNIEGDFAECGIWRGGVCIYMQAVQRTLGENRKIFCCDSFEGLPKPKRTFVGEEYVDNLWKYDILKVPVVDVLVNFKKYDLWGDNIVIVKGWFCDTLPTAPIEKLSILRLDGDLYESTMDILENLYPKLSIGGYCIVDDYRGIKQCKTAIHDFRDKNGITESIIDIDTMGVYWRKVR